jgi:hypothetical protein
LCFHSDSCQEKYTFLFPKLDGMVNSLEAILTEDRLSGTKNIKYSSNCKTIHGNVIAVLGPQLNDCVSIMASNGTLGLYISRT